MEKYKDIRVCAPQCNNPLFFQTKRKPKLMKNTAIRMKMQLNMAVPKEIKTGMYVLSTGVSKQTRPCQNKMLTPANADLLPNEKRMCLNSPTKTIKKPTAVITNSIPGFSKIRVCRAVLRNGIPKCTKPAERNVWNKKRTKKNKKRKKRNQIKTRLESWVTIHLCQLDAGGIFQIQSGDLCRLNTRKTIIFSFCDTAPNKTINNPWLAVWPIFTENRATQEQSPQLPKCGKLWQIPFLWMTLKNTAKAVLFAYSLEPLFKNPMQILKNTWWIPNPTLTTPIYGTSSRLQTKNYLKMGWIWWLWKLSTTILPTR